MAMEGRGRSTSQSHLGQINTPWTEANVSRSQPRGWRGPSLPPIIHIPSQRASTPVELHSRPPSSVRSSISEESSTKRPKIESSDLAISHLVSLPQLRATHSGSRDSRKISSNFARPEHDSERCESEYLPTPADLTILCSRCRRPTNDQSNDLSSGQTAIGHSSHDNSNMILVAQSTTAELTKILNTLNLGLSCVRRGANHASELPQQEILNQSPVDTRELKSQLDAILRKTCHVRDLATELLTQVKSSNSENESRDQMWHGGPSSHDMRESRKRHLEAMTDDYENTSAESAELLTDTTSYTGRGTALNVSNRDDIRRMRSQQIQNPSMLYGRNGQPSIMNPPPALSRSQPLSPGQSLPSPTSGNYPPSPSATSYGSVSSQQPTLSGAGTLGGPRVPYLPSFASSYASSDSAFQAHTAALQHEVSVQKIALSSLQGEHDKLLAALSRSQIRASALEKKHSVSDNEIITLTEEKLRLQTQVQEMEKDVEDLTRSRDEARRSAVVEASQYVDIVKRATQLEMLAAEERRLWNQLKREMEGKIEVLTRSIERSTSSPGEGLTKGSDEIGVDQMDIMRDGSLTAPSEASTWPSAQHPQQTQYVQEDTKNLKAEVERLRLRCVQVEGTLREVRAESQSVEGIVRLLEATRRSIQEKVDLVLNDSSSTG